MGSADSFIRFGSVNEIKGVPLAGQKLNKIENKIEQNDL